MAVHYIIIWIMSFALLWHEANTCLAQEQMFVACYQQLAQMENSNTFSETICSESGKQVVQCLQNTTDQCPHLWTETYLGNLSVKQEFISSLPQFDEHYAFNCLQLLPACKVAWNCFDSVFKTPPNDSYVGLAECYAWFCGSEYGITYIHNCFLPVEQQCPSTLDYLRNIEIIVYPGNGEALSFKVIEDKAGLECNASKDESYGVIAECLRNNASGCSTNPEINFGRNILQCDYTAETGPCLETSCGSPVKDFILSMFEFLRCNFNNTITPDVTTIPPSITTTSSTTMPSSTASLTTTTSSPITSALTTLTSSIATRTLTTVSYSTTSQYSTSTPSSSSTLSTTAALSSTTITSSTTVTSPSTSQSQTASSTGIIMATCDAEETSIQIGDVDITLHYQTTLQETTVFKDCPSEYKGMMLRLCSTDGIWKPVMENCSLDIAGLQEDMLALMNDTVNDAVFQEVLDNLSRITEPSRDKRNKPQLDDFRNLISDATDVFVRKTTIKEKELDTIFHLVSNAIDETTKAEWNQLKEEKIEGANTIMKDVDRIIRKVGSQQCSSLKVGESLQINRKNLDIIFGESDSDISFASSDNTDKLMREIFIAAEALQNQGFTSDICYGGVRYKTISPLLSRRLVKNGEIEAFEGGRYFITDVIGLLLDRDLVNITPPIILHFPLNSTNLYSPRCVSWDFSVRDTNGGGAWTTKGCSLKNTTETQVVCACSHLTNFAVLMSISTASEDHARILSIISAIGCALAICGLILTISFHLLVWRLVRSDRSTILMNLCAALLLALSVFLAGINRVESDIACTLIAAILQFLFLVVFFLMLVEGIELLIRVIHMFKTRFRLKILLSLAWFTPALIVAVSMAITKTDGYGNKKYCWLDIDSGLIWAFIGPAALVIFINFIVIVVVFIKLFSTKAMKDKTKKEKAKTGLRSICVLLPLMGVTWIFGLLSVNKETVVFQYIFAILNSLQGLFIFLFHCIFNSQLRDAFSKRNARKRSLATLSSDLRKRSRTDSKETDEAQVSARRTSVEKTPTHPSEKKQPCGNRRAKTNKYALEEDIEDWQKQRRKEHQQAIRRQIAKKLTWTK